MTPWSVPCQAPLSMEFSRQEYRSGLPFSSLRDLSDPGIEPGSPALQADALLSAPLGSSDVEFRYVPKGYLRGGIILIDNIIMPVKTRNIYSSMALSTRPPFLVLKIPPPKKLSFYTHHIFI